MAEDNEGFRYPKVDLELCIDCSLCEKVCPVIHQGDEPAAQPACYAAKNKNETIRCESSSGGVFTLLAEQVIREGGVVFGARFDTNWEVMHDYVDTMEGLAAFRGSKYLQSRIGNSFLQAREFLKAGRQVLFSASPCQIAGLKLFLRKEYTNLLAVDFVCHGVPSPKVWRLYKQELLDLVEQKNSVSATPKPHFLDIRFRDKTEGWKKFSFAATIRVADQNTVSQRELLHDNLYMRGFLRDLYLRPSCHACPSKSFKSGSDLTIADFWGIQNHLPEFDDDRGASLVMITSEKGQQAYAALGETQEVTPVSYEIAYAGNPSIALSCKPHPNRAKFFQKLEQKPISLLIRQLTHPPLKQRLFANIYGIARRIGVINLIKKFR